MIVYKKKKNYGHWFCIKTRPNNIADYSAIFTANMNKLNVILFQLFTIKGVKIHLV